MKIICSFYSMLLYKHVFDCCLVLSVDWNSFSFCFGVNEDWSYQMCLKQRKIIGFETTIRHYTHS